MLRCGLVETAHFRARMMLVHILALPLTAGDLGELNPYISWDVLRNHPLTHWNIRKFIISQQIQRQGRLQSWSVLYLRFLPSFCCARLPVGFRLLFWLHSQAGSHSCIMVFRGSQQSLHRHGLSSFCLIGHLSPCLDQ